MSRTNRFGFGPQERNQLVAADFSPSSAREHSENRESPALNRAGTDGLGDACDADIDGDGYTDAQESALGKNPLSYCTVMRADIDGDHTVSILDISAAAQSYGQSVPPAPERRNQDGDSVISILDLSKIASVFLQPVSACP